ncbi:MAG: hypothetical protein GX442_15820 [Candidatus Riflebacteria bacterium]|nr:hypothetical protein [Candidatus Riflebacteria bacterium]
MILGVVILISLVLGVFIFSYNSMVRQQNIRAHHELIGETAGMLAMTGVQLFADKITTSLNAIIMAAAPVLLSSVPTSPTISVGTGHPICTQMQADFDLLLGQLPHLVDQSVIPPRSPRCLSMDISFEGIQQISPNTDSVQFQAGRDPVEKLGEIVISCVVEHRGLRRKAQMRRQFRVVSMVPGPFARFSLFVPYTPWPYSYDALGVKYSGQIDTGYIHPFPAPRTYTNPLKIFNGTDSYSGTAPDDRADLRNRGWIFLGPSFDTSTGGATGTVLLRLPSGFDSNTGGHFLFCLPPNVLSGKEVVRPERIDDPAHFNLPPVAVATFQIGGLFQGYYTNDPGLGANQAMGAAGANLWSGLVANAGTGWTPSDRWYCASSWLYPYGDRNDPSRTLMVGPVLAAFLKMYFVKSTTATWKFLIPGLAETDYHPASDVPNLNMKFQELYKMPVSAPPKPGYTSYSRVMPLNADVNPSVYPPTSGYAFNTFFDFMKYPPVGTPFPNLDEGSTILGAIPKPYFVPCAEAMRLPPSGIKGLHPFEDFRVLFTESGGSDPTADPDNCYFSGNLMAFRFTAGNLLGRVTHYLDLSDCASQGEEDDRLKDLLFRPAVAADGAPGTTNWWVPKRAGIFYAKRRTTVSTGGDRLSLPGRVWLTKPFILIVEKGDLTIPQKIESPVSGGAPETLCSLVVLEGNLLVGTTDEIHAYLVALNPGPGGHGGGGRVLSADPPPTGSVRRLNVFGGVAAWEMGLYRSDPVRTTMGDFTDGGSIRYNPRFNPSSEVYPASRMFLMEEKASQILITGAD